MSGVLADRATLDALLLDLDAGTTESGPTLLAVACSQAELGRPREAFLALRRLVALDPSYRLWTRAARLMRELRREGHRPEGSLTARVSLLGTSTLDQLRPLIELAGLAADLDLEVSVAGFGQYEAEVLDPGSSLHASRPDAVVLAPDTAALRLPVIARDPDAVVEENMVRCTAMWSGLRAHSDAQLLQLNFVPPYARPLGSLEAVHPGSRRQVVAGLNRRLAAAAASERVAIVDAEAVATTYGLERWSDDRYWFHAKQAVSLGALPRLATEIAAVLRASLGRSRKVLVTDLDNTLWGGVAGDDGVGGLQLSGSAVGEAHLALQSLLRDLRGRGVLLAVCSKNDESTARAPFLERDDMLLSLDDFVGFVASWETKVEGIRTLAAQLDLGLDAFVFLDDNPAERAIVREHLPMVDVIELPRDAAGYQRALADYRGFEPAAVTGEDAARTEQYRARTAAAQVRQSAATFDEYLHSLAMVADVRPFDDLTLTRVSQLVGKTNQWNLTTRRHSPEALRRFADDPDTVAFSVRLSDRFADHGIIAVAIASVVDDALEIDTLLMSCRVIGRTVEHTILDALIRAATDRGIRRVRGVYRETERNGLVASLYEQLGFSVVERTSDGSVWQLTLDGAPRTRNRFIAQGVGV